MLGVLLWESKGRKGVVGEEMVIARGKKEGTRYERKRSEGKIERWKGKDRKL